MAHIYTGKNISFQFGGKFLQAGTSHAAFAAIVEHALKGDYAKAAELLDLKKVVQGAPNDDVVKRRRIAWRNRS